MRTLNQFTLGELSSMRDALRLAREDVMQDSKVNYTTRKAICRITEVLDSIVEGSPFYRTREETLRLQVKR